MIISCKRQLCVKALAQSEGVPFGLSSIANALPSSVSQVEEVPKYPNKDLPLVPIAGGQSWGKHEGEDAAKRPHHAETA